MVGVSNGVVSDLRRLTRLAPPRFSTIYNPVPKRPSPTLEALREADDLWGAQGGGRVLNVGTLKRQKNQALLLEAFARLEGEDRRLMFVGDGPCHDELQDLAASLGVADRTVFAGYRADPTPFYATADVFVLSSDYEGFGNVIVEALQQGLPVVSTDCHSGPDEILDYGTFGKLVPVGDVIALAQGIEAALSTPGNRDRQRARANKFLPDVAGLEYLRLLCPDVT